MTNAECNGCPGPFVDSSGFIHPCAHNHADRGRFWSLADYLGICLEDGEEVRELGAAD